MDRALHFFLTPLLLIGPYSVGCTFVIYYFFSLEAVLRDKQGREESKSQKAKDDPIRRSANYQEEVMFIPKDKAGFVIRKMGWRVKDIMQKSGVQELSIKEDLVHLKGTEEQRASAKKIIDTILWVHFKYSFSILISFSFCVPFFDLTIYLFNVFLSSSLPWLPFLLG